jgi:tetratricopeptide (TPR) repeat protein
MRSYHSHIRWIVYLLWAVLNAAQFAFAHDGREQFVGEINPLEERLFADAADGRLDEHSLLSAALIAGGADDGEAIAGYQRYFDSLAEELRESGELTGSPKQRIKVIFNFLHSRVLYGGYDIECTDPRMALDRGRFNCVSATLLLNCLARDCGFYACALETPGHVMSRVYLPGGSLDVETTNGFYNGATTARADARELSDVSFVAAIYYNRGIELLAQRDFAAAASANAKALQLDPSSRVAWDNLLVTINNWAISLASQRQFEAADALLKQGLSLDPDFDLFSRNSSLLRRQWARYGLVGSGE